MTPSSAETQDPNAPYLDTIRQTKRALRAAMPDLKERFAALTQQIEAQVQAIEAERAAGLPTVPSIQAADLEHLDRVTIDRVRQRGCVVVRGVFDPARVQAWNVEVADYLERNQYLEKEVSKRGIDKYFSTLASSRPQIFGVYWSGPQMEARQSEELAREVKAMVKAFLRIVVNTLLYINSASCETKTADNEAQRKELQKALDRKKHKNGKDAKKLGRDLDNLPKYRVTWIGPTIETSAGSETDLTGTRTVKGHIRRGHWHTYRVGPRKTEAGERIDPAMRKSSLKWIAPVWVGGGAPEDKPRVYAVREPTSP